MAALLCEQTYFSDKQNRLVASFFDAQRRDHLRTFEQYSSDFIGNIKQQINLKLQCLDTRHLSTDFGVTSRHKLVDDQSNLFDWKASSQELESLHRRRSSIPARKRHEKNATIRKTNSPP